MRGWRACALLFALLAQLGVVQGLSAPLLTRVYKGPSVVPALSDLQPLYIPDGQCSGYISHMPCDGAAALALSVSAWDAARLPEVMVEEALDAVAVYRRGGRCHGEANITVGVACLLAAPAPSAPRRRVRSARAMRTPLPPVPTRR